MFQVHLSHKVSNAVAITLVTISSWAQTIDTPPAVEVGDKWTTRFHNIGDKREPYLLTTEVKSIDGTSAWLYGESQQPNAQPPKYVWRFDLKRAESLERFEFDAAAPNGAGKRLVDRRANDDSLQFPLSVGKKYAVKQNWDNGKGFTEYKAEVQALERVRVEAGEFDAYRIKYVGFWTNTDGRSYSGRAEWTRWYAPSVKTTVKSEFFDRTTDNRTWNQNTSELVKWAPAGSGNMSSMPAPGSSAPK